MIKLLYLSVLLTLSSCNLSFANADLPSSLINSHSKSIILQLKWLRQYQLVDYYVAKSQGFNQQVGRYVKILECGPPTLVIPIVLSGLAQYGISDTEILQKYIKGKPIVVFKAIFQHSLDLILSPPETKNQSSADLKSKRIMLSDNQGFAQLQIMPKHKSLKLNQINILPHSWSLEDLIQDKVDAAYTYITTDPNYLLSHGIKSSVLNSVEYGVDFYGDKLLTTRTEVQFHPKSVEALFRAIENRWAYVLTHQDEMTSQILNMDGVSKRDITREILLAEAKVMLPLILADIFEIGTMNLGRWQRIVDSFVSVGMGQKKYDLSNFIHQPSQIINPSTKRIFILLSLIVLLIVIFNTLMSIRARNKNKVQLVELENEVALRLKLQEQLKISQHRVDETFKATSSGIAVTSLAGHYLMANPAYCRMLGYSEEELKETNFIELTYSEDRVLNTNQVALLIAGEISDFNLEKRYIKKDGSVVWVRASISMMRDADGKNSGMIAVTEDIGERIKIEEVINHTQKLVKIAGNLAHVGGWSLNVSNWQLSWSEEINKIFELPNDVTPSVEEVINFYTPNYRDKIKQLSQDCINLGQAYDEELELISAKNHHKWVRVVAQASRNEKGVITQIHGAFQDITENKRMQLFAQAQSAILESIAKGTDLDQVLSALVKLVETQLPETVGVISLLNDAGTNVQRVIAVKLSNEYLNSLVGLEAGPNHAPSGSAELKTHTIILANVTNDPLWTNHRELALAEGLRACWSIPIFSSIDVLMGTFSVYAKSIYAPSAEELDAVNSCAKIAAIAIDRAKTLKHINLLDTAVSRLNDIVIITDAESYGEPATVVYVNEAFERLTGFSKEAVIGHTPRILQGKNTQRHELDRIHQALQKWQPVRAELINYKKSGEEFWLELDIVPIADEKGWYTHWVAVERDITERKEAEIELNRLNRAMRMLSTCNEKLIRAGDEIKLIQEICKLSVEVGGYRMAWVGYAKNDIHKSITPMCYFGKNDGFLENLKLSWSEHDTKGKGPGGKTIRGGKTIIVESIADDPTYPAIEEAIAQGYLSLISLPLCNQDQTFGFLALYADEVRAIPANEIKLLEEMADDLAFGIINIRAEIDRKKIEIAVSKVASSVSASASDEFFVQLCRSLAEAVEADGAFVARLLPNETMKARTIAAVIDGMVLENIEYDLSTSPCSQLLHSDNFVMSGSAEQCFQLSPVMVSLRMKGYIVQRLINNQGTVIGMIFVLTREIIIKSEFVVSALKIFSVRAAAEIERQEYDRHIHQQASLLDKAQDAILVRGLDHAIHYWNKSAERIYGWKAEEVNGKIITEFFYEDMTDFNNAMEILLASGEWNGELRQKCKDGHFIIIEGRWSLVRNDQGIATSVLCINSDITQRKADSDKIQHLAFYDALTGLPNRLLLKDRLQHALATSARSRKYGALFFIDLDNFKSLNDTMGHAMGDMLLQEIAARLLRCLRLTDTVARLGGDEFILMLEDIGTTAAESAIQCQTFAEKIIQLFNQPFKLDGHQHHSTPSMGITLFQGQQDSVTELLKRADLAMYEAKGAGGSTFRFYDPDMQLQVLARMALESDMRFGIEQKEFTLHYQPQLDRQLNVIGAEALLRWQHKSKGMISPLQFIPLAEETRLILPLGKLVLQSACETLVQWAKKPILANLILSVNVSIQQFRQADFVELILSLLGQTGADPSKLKLELTESIFVENVEDIIHKMTALKLHGVTFSLDDFGTGYSSLSYLKRLPISQLKIDKAFVRDILNNEHDATIARSIITLAQNLGLEVIAEGVELDEQRLFLEKEGCYFYQGYLFSKPLPEAQFQSFVGSR